MHDKNITHRCRLCHSGPEGQRIRANFVYGGNEFNKFWQCDRCDAVYLFPTPSEKEEAYFYQREFEQFMSNRCGKDRNWSNPEEHIQSNKDQILRRWRLIAPFIKPGLDLLEIGCSSGYMLKYFREKGLKCVGVEPSGAYIEFLNSNGYEAYNTLEELKKNKIGLFDLVVHFFVLEHIRNPFTFFKETLDLLRPGGKMLSEIPCVNDPLTSLFSIPAFERFYWSIAHHFYYSPKSLKFVMDKLKLSYEMIPEQRYDLSNHITWMMEGRPGGQGKYEHVFSRDLIEKYKNDLKSKWICDTIFLIVSK